MRRPLAHRTPRGLRRALPALALLATLSVPAAAQVSAGGGFVLESYTFDEPGATGFEGLDLTTLPFAVAVDVTPQLELSLGGAWAEGEMTLEDGSTISLSGLTDTSVRASWTLGRDRVVLSGAVFLPTGETNLTAEQALLAGTVAYDLLPTRISNWGTGGGGDVSVAVALPAGAVNFGARVGYRLVSEYEPYDAEIPPFGQSQSTGEAFAFDPGDQFYVRAALDANLSDASKFSLSATYQTYSDDAAEGTNVFRSGDRLQAMASVIFPAGRSGNAWLYGGALHRSEGEFLELDIEDRPSQNVFFGGLGARVLIGGVGFLPVAEARGLQTDDGFGQGWAIGAGASLEIPLGDGPALVPTGKYRFGTVLVNDDVDSSFTGYEIGLSLRGIGR